MTRGRSNGTPEGHSIGTLGWVVQRFALLGIGAWGLLAPGGAAAADPHRIYDFSIVPQQAAQTTVRQWGPLLEYLSRRSGHRLRLRTYKSIPDFEAALDRGADDLAYMNPYHYVVAHARQGYTAFARERGVRLKGILVVRRDGPIRTVDQLQGRALAFPAPRAFAATLLNLQGLRDMGIRARPVYVRSHESVYLNVAAGRFPAGGGVPRTLGTLAPGLRDQLRILRVTRGYSPHALAAHPRVPAAVVQALQTTLLAMGEDAAGRAALRRLAIGAFEAARDADWNDIRRLTLGDPPMKDNTHAPETTARYHR